MTDYTNSLMWLTVVSVIMLVGPAIVAMVMPGGEVRDEYAGFEANSPATTEPHHEGKWKIFVKEHFHLGHRHHEGHAA